MTCDFDAAQRHARDFTRGHSKLSARQTGSFLSFRESFVRLGRLDFHFFEQNYSSPYDVCIEPDVTQIVVHIPFRSGFVLAQGNRQVQVDPGQIVVVSPTERYRKQWFDCSELLTIVVKRDLLSQISSAEGERGGLEGLRFMPLARGNLADLPTLWGFIQVLCADLDRQNPQSTEPLVADAFERTLGLLLLRSIATSGGDRTLASADVLPGFMTRADRYIRRNLVDDLTVDSIAAAGGISVRSLYYAFSKFRGTTPTRYVKQLRLEKARTELSEAAQSGKSVTQIATCSGYSDLSRFSQDYRRRFGETPRQTIAENVLRQNDN